MPNSLQHLVEALASEIGRPVGVDDRRFRALAYSPHDDEVDRVRRDSIMKRQAPRAVTEWLLSLGIESASEELRVPTNRELGMEARLCFPLRFDDVLHGYLWLIDDLELVKPARLRIVAEYAGEIAAELVRAHRLEDTGREMRAAELRRLLFGVGPPSTVTEASGEAILSPAFRYVALVARPGPQPGPEALVHLSFAAEEVRRSVPPDHALSLQHQGDLILVLAYEDADDPRRRAITLLDACRRQLAGEHPLVSVGIGGPRGDLAALRDSYREALLAVEVARRVPALADESPLGWEGLGAYRTLAALLGDRDPAHLIPPPLTRLLAERDGTGLAETLETYLETGCDARAASARLYLHRSSLYKRLQRIERIAGCDLRQGSDRLELHMGLRLWRLGGAEGSRQLSASAA